MTLPSRPGQGGSGTQWPGGDRPGWGANRPGWNGNRPGRPGIGNGNNIIGGGNTIIGGGNTNINNNWNNINVNNRVGWNQPGWNRGGWNNPGWGWGGGGSWHNNWHNSCINNHYGWYNGCWSGNYWGSNWYAPLAWTAAGWGLGAVTTGWGYGAAYYNPYYAVASTPVYDYSQPVVVYQYVTDGGTAGTGDVVAQATPTGVPQTTQIAQPATADSPGMKEFDAGLARFKAGEYSAALGEFDAALKALPGDPVIHEVRALALFAVGDYTPAAAALNSLLSAAPGMDWTTMSSLYGNSDDYTTQLRKCEAFAKAHPDDAAPYFVLAYQYLVIGSKEAAVEALRIVVKDQPKDATAKRMLDALAPPETVAQTPTPEPPPPTASADDKPNTDLVGTWKASADGSTIELTITEDSKFTWKATQSGKPPVELKGDIGGVDQQLILQSAQQGAMSGDVKSEGADRWKFSLTGAPPNDPGLTFERVSKS